MKNVRICLISLILFQLSFQNSFAQSSASNLSNLFDWINVYSNLSPVFTQSDGLPWASSLYLSGGFGIPQGLRFELGYNFGDNISLAAAFGINDNWSRDPEEGTIGATAKVYLFQIQSVRTYFLVGFGSTLSIMGSPDKYSLLQIGAKVPVNNWLQLCPEFGYVYTIKHLPLLAMDERNTRLGFNISAELIFRQIP